MSRNWQYNEAKALISVYGNRKEEFFRTRPKKNFWQNILTDLESLNVLTMPTTIVHVEVKWKTLVRAYKNAKDRGTGSSASKFFYMGQMDGVFAFNPIMSCTHAVGVGVEQNPKAVDTSSKSDYSSKNKENAARKCSPKNYKQAYLDMKKEYYDAKLKEKAKRTALLESYIEAKKL